MPTAQVNDIEMYYEVHGDGEPLTLIVGLASDISEWGPIIAGLAARFRVIAFDNRGAGRTSKPNQPYSVEEMAEDVAGLLAALGVRRTRVLGVSMGGRIALALTLAHPTLVEQLVLVSTAARVGRRPWWFGLAGLLSQAPGLRGKYPQPRYAYRSQSAASSAYNCAARLGEIYAPTLIMQGRRDQLTPFALAEELRDGIPSARLLAFDGGHLFFLLRERQRFLDAALDFLSQ